MAFIKKLNELSSAKAALAAQEKQFNEERVEALFSLHTQFGYPDLKTFIKALKAVPAPKKKKGKAKAKSAGASKKLRLLPETKQALIDAAKSGKSGAELAKEFKVSIATVHNLKKAAGLVKARA